MSEGVFTGYVPSLFPKIVTQFVFSYLQDCHVLYSKIAPSAFDDTSSSHYYINMNMFQPFPPSKPKRLTSIILLLISARRYRYYIPPNSTSLASPQRLQPSCPTTTPKYTYDETLMTSDDKNRIEIKPKKSE